MPPAGFETPREVYVACPQCGRTPCELLKQMRTTRVLRCTVCSTLWREPLPAPQSRSGTVAQAGAKKRDEAPVTLVPLPDRRKPGDRRRTGFGGRREDDVKRPTADPRKWRPRRPGKSER